MLHFFLARDESLEYCFNVEATAPLDAKELAVLRQLLADGFVSESISTKPTHPDGRDVVELGPRMNFATAYSTNIVAICQTCGLEKGVNALLEIPGLAMDEWDRNLYYDYFVKEEGRNPTIVEIRDLDNANSEHSRHGYFKGKQMINGVVMPETMMDIEKSTLKMNPSKSITAFKDNSSGIRGYDCWTILPGQPGKPAPFTKQKVQYHIIFTAETHNFPTGVAPFPGAG